MKLFTDNINIMFESERMFIQGMDGARVSIFEITLPSSWFDKYEHEDEGTVLIGISSSLLFRVLNTRDKSQNLTIQFDKENSDKLLVDFTGESKVAFDKHFELPLMDIDEEMMAIPEIEYQAEFSLSSANYSNMINQMKMFGDCLEIKCSEDRIDLLSNSVDLGKMSVNIPIEDLTEFSINEGETLDISFSLNYMHMFCMYSKLPKDVNLSVSDNYPMKMVYKLGEEGAEMIFYLAPKLSND